MAMWRDDRMEKFLIFLIFFWIRRSVDYLSELEPELQLVVKAFQTRPNCSRMIESLWAFNL